MPASGQGASTQRHVRAFPAVLDVPAMKGRYACGAGKLREHVYFHLYLRVYSKPLRADARVADSARRMHRVAVCRGSIRREYPVETRA